MIIASTSHLFSCFCIKGEGGIGTAFAYHHGERTFFLTAKHVLRNAMAGGFVYLKTPSNWKRFELSGTTAHPNGQDAATFGLVGFHITVEHEFTHENEPGLGLGQELKFTGFPHGLENTAASDTGYSTPLVRTAFFSGIVISPINKSRLLILDGLNNPGYSGGPIWAPGPTAQQPTLLGLISGYRVEERGKSLVYKKDKDGESPADGLYVKPNSGMIHAIDFADIQLLVGVSDDRNENI